MTAKTQCWSSIMSGIVFVGLLGTTGLVGCEQQQPAMDTKQTTPPVSSKSEPAAGDAIPAAGEYTMLVPPVSSPGRVATDKGISHAHQDHWDVAEDHFRTAVEADPNRAETHFNLGLALAKLGRHDEATIAFEKAAEMAPGDRKITESPVLQRHTRT